jgi:hypothetical protein
MKKYLSVLFLAIIFSGCTVSGFYVLNLTGVECPQSAKERYGEQKIINFKESNGKTYVYEDELIKIAWFPSSTAFSFILENKSDYSIKIIWDDASYVNTKGYSGRVVHSGVKYNERNNSQPPTVIAKKTYLDDLLIPTENIYYDEAWVLFWGNIGSAWKIKPLIPNIAETKKDLYYLTKQYIGKTVKILLPLQVQETVNDYIFTFNITDFIIKN